LPIEDYHGPLESESLQVKLVNDKGISFEMSCDEYIKIFNRLMNVGRIAHPMRISPKSLNNSSMFTKVGTFIIMNFSKNSRGVKHVIKISIIGFQPQGFEGKSF